MSIPGTCRVFFLCTGSDWRAISSEGEFGEVAGRRKGRGGGGRGNSHVRDTFAICNFRQMRLCQLKSRLRTTQDRHGEEEGFVKLWVLLLH